MNITIGKALKKAKAYLNSKGIHSSSIDAEVILMCVLNKEKSYLYTYPEKLLNKSEEEAFLRLLRLRGKRYPLAYVVGEKEFYGFSFYVEKGVFCPRPETELIIDELKALFKYDEFFDLYEIGCGTGIISISIAKIFKNANIICCDISSRALEVTEKNIERHQVKDRVKLLNGAFFDAAKGKFFDIVVSNPPYLSRNDYLEAAPEVRKEPRKALMSRDKGLAAIKKIIKESHRYLKKEGIVLLEIGHGQGEIIKNYAEKSGFKCLIKNDLAGFERLAIIKTIL